MQIATEPSQCAPPNWPVSSGRKHTHCANPHSNYRSTQTNPAISRLSASPTPGNDTRHPNGAPVASEKPTPKRTFTILLHPTCVCDFRVIVIIENRLACVWSCLARGEPSLTALPSPPAPEIRCSPSFGFPPQVPSVRQMLRCRPALQVHPPHPCAALRSAPDPLPKT